MGTRQRKKRRRRVEPTDDWEQLELLCVWDEQVEYERIRPLVLFGEPVTERAVRTGISDRTQVRDERRENFACYVVMDARQRVGDRDAAELFWGTFAKTYVEDGCEVHVHFRAGLVEGRVADDWCAVFNRKRDWLDFVGSYAFRNPEREMGDACK